MKPTYSSRWTQKHPSVPQNLNANHLYKPTRYWHANITHHKEKREKVFSSQSQNLSASLHRRLPTPAVELTFSRARLFYYTKNVDAIAMNNEAAIA